MRERILAAAGLMAALANACATSSGRASSSAAPSADVFPSSSSSSASSTGDLAGEEAAAIVPAPPPVVCEARVGVDRLRRSSLKRMVDGGLGRWLQTVSVDRMLVKGRFKGWIVRSLGSADRCYAGVDLRAGDIVTRVNGHPVERPEQALAVWTALPSSAELVVDLVRDGQPRTVRFGIVDP